MLRTGQEQCGNFPEGPNYYCCVEQGYDSGPVFEKRIRGVFVSNCFLFGIGQADAACSVSDECMRPFPAQSELARKRSRWGLYGALRGVFHARTNCIVDQPLYVGGRVSLARYVTRPNMKPALLPISMAVAAALTVAAVSSRAQAPGVYALHEVPEGATLHKVTADPAEYKGRKALKVEFTEAANKERPGVGGDMPTFVLIPTNFKNGTIEVDLLGRLNGKGLPDARAFVGLAYRVDDEARFEAVYLRPLNGRKKNPPSPRDKRAIQYFAYPDWKFGRLRREYPDGRYESGADIADDEWITLKLDIDDTRVRVSTNGKEELALTDTKAAPEAGAIGLWVGRGTEAYFANLRITPR
jgi:hypothetical protein